MSGWDSYRAVYGAELRAAAREFDDHGWSVAEQTATTLLLITGRALDVLEVAEATGRRMCAELRDAGRVVPVAATDAGSWWFPMSAGAELPAELASAAGAVQHDGWVHWRVAPALVGYKVPPADVIFHAAVDAVRRQTDHETYPGAQRSAGVGVAVMRS
jgi:hypothetical protein